MDSNEKNIKQYQFTAGNQQILSAEIKQENIEKEMLVPEKSQISTAVADNPPKIVIKGATYRSSNETINKQHNSTEANEQMFSVSEVKQKTIKDDELELDVKDSKLSTPEVRKNIPDKSPEYSEEKICDSAVTPATGIKNEQFYTAKSGFNECGSPKKHEYLRKRPPLCEGLTPVGISHVSKVMSAKGDIYTSADLRSPNVLDGKKCNLTTSYENLNTTDLNEISIELDGQQSFSRPEMEKEDNLQVYLSDNLKEPEISKHGNFKKMAAVDSNSSDKTNRHDFSETLLCNIPIVDIKQELNEENNAFDICYDHNDPQTEETVNETNKQYNFLSDDQQSFLRPEIKQEVIKNDNLQEYLSDDLNFKKLAALDSTSSDETDRHDFSETLLCNIPMVDIKQELIEENNALDMCHDHNDRQTEETNLSNCKTLWLSASNLDDFNNTEEDNDENKDPNINLTNLSTKSLRNALNDIINTRKNLENKCPTIKEAANSKTTDILDSSVVLLKDKDDESNIKEVINSNISDIPDYVATSSKLRVNNGISTPILKKKDVHIKLCFPANFGSMSIASSGAAKLKHTHNKEEISTQVIKQQTPFKTPQSKFQNFLLENEPGTSSTNSALIQLPEKHLAMGHSQIVNDENSQSLVSVSSMTESSLWTSMTRIVKRVLGITNQNEDIFDNCPNNNSISFKRQLSSESDSDSDFNFSAAPRPKRFKFSDIKCRRPIRDEYALELPSRISPSSNRVATFEIVKSVRTYDGRRYVRRMCDKATQTDDYLMDGLQPQTN